jgi:hypothetical protein
MDIYRERLIAISSVEPSLYVNEGSGSGNIAGRDPL